MAFGSYATAVTEGHVGDDAGADAARDAGAYARDGVTRDDRRRAIRDSLVLGISVGVYGLAFGAASTSAGLDVLQTSALSLLMFTGGSQFALVGVLGAGGSAAPALSAAFLLGARNTLYGVRLASLITVSGPRRLVAAQGVIDETTAMALGQAKPAAARLAFWVTFVSIYLTWNATTVIGALVAQGLGGAAMAALDAVVPAAFLALLWPWLRQGVDQRWAAFGGAAIAAGAVLLPPGLPVLLAAVSALVVAATVKERRGGDAR